MQGNGEPGAHYELLIRMRDEAGQLIAPGLFIAAAERYGLMTAIDRWVIAQAFTWLVSEADERERLSLCAINLSGAEFAENTEIITMLRGMGIDYAQGYGVSEPKRLLQAVA